MHQRVLKMMALGMLCSAIAACGGSSTENNDGSKTLTPEEQSQRCDAARTAAADAYNAMDRSCLEDSDCQALPIGGCNCLIPLSKSADTAAYEAAVADAKGVCDEYYAAPGAFTCQNAVICDYSSLEADTATCNAQGFCDEPPINDLEQP